MPFLVGQVLAVGANFVVTGEAGVREDLFVTLDAVWLLLFHDVSVTGQIEITIGTTEGNLLDSCSSSDVHDEVNSLGLHSWIGQVLRSG